MTVRTFIAFPIDPGPRLCRVIDQLKLIGAPIRISRSPNLHLTLWFLGDTDEKRLPDVIRILADVLTDESAVRVQLSGMGVFPDRRRPSVVWAGIRESQRVNAIQSRLTSRLTEAGWDEESRPWRPHVTLARINPRRPVPESLHELLDRHQSTDFGEALLDRVILYQSERDPRGTRYTAIHTFELGET